MRKYENVDIIASLGAVMELNTEHYKSDFSYDIKMFMEAARHPTEENTHLLWLSRRCGTECFRERDTYLKESQASHTWTFHATTGDSILAYAVEITGLRDGKVMGNLYELDYRQHAAKLGQQALPIQEVSLKFEDGTEGRYPYEQYNHGIDERESCIGTSRCFLFLVFFSNTVPRSKSMSPTRTWSSSPIRKPQP